jgi:hypothetical protein
MAYPCREVGPAQGRIAMTRRHRQMHLWTWLVVVIVIAVFGTAIRTGGIP